VKTEDEIAEQTIEAGESRPGYRVSRAGNIILSYALLKELIAEAVTVDREQHYVIVQGGGIQDSSVGLRTVDLDWMDSVEPDDIPDLDDLMEMRDILDLAISEFGLWQDERNEIDNIIEGELRIHGLAEEDFR
jgi:hypothetical protein